MTYINKNQSTQLLQKLIKRNLSKQLEHMPSSFKKEQEQAIDFFIKRTYLEDCIDKCLSFNKNLNYEKRNNISLIQNAEDIIEVFKLRSLIYTQINYQKEFPDTIKGLNFDEYDFNSAILISRANKIITGTTRIVYDSKTKLPIEEKYAFEKERKEYKTITELSRFAVKKDSKGLSLDFKNLMGAAYYFFEQNEVDIFFTVIIKEHLKLYSKFGGTQVIKEFDAYGNLGKGTAVLSWNPKESSKFFKKAFL